VTVKPGAYPWKNHLNAWRPAHIHFSVFGSQLQSRLVTQMYFPGDPLMPLDPILQSVPDEEGRRRLVAAFDLETTEPDCARAYRRLAVKPPAPAGEAPHLNLTVFARGLLRHLVTRLYFPDETAANAADPVLKLVAGPTARSTLVARAEGGVLRFDIRLQGERE